MSSKQTPETPDAATVLISTFALSDLSPPPTTKQLTLTADFPLETYESLLSTFSLPASLPDSITSLTLELFTYGFPPGFLTSLISLLPNLKELTLYLQLIAGTTAESFSDAATFLRTALSNGLQKLKLVDVFVPPDFLPAIAKDGKEAWKLMDLTLLYTFRSADPEFNERLPVASIPELLTPGLERLTIRIQSEAEDKPGMTPCAGDAGKGVVEALMGWTEEEARGVKRLDLSAFALDAQTVRALGAKFGGAREVAWAVSVDGKEDGKRGVMKAIGRETEELEVVACPGLEFYGALRRDADSTLGTVLWSRKDVEEVAKAAAGLRSVDVSIFRVPELGFSSWAKGEDGWSGENRLGAKLTENEKAAIAKREEGGREGTRLEELV